MSVQVLCCIDIVMQCIFVHIQYGSTPLLLACQRGHMDLALMLIEKYGANPTADDKVRVRSDDG